MISADGYSRRTPAGAECLYRVLSSRFSGFEARLCHTHRVVVTPTRKRVPTIRYRFGDFKAILGDYGVSCRLLAHQLPTKCSTIGAREDAELDAGRDASRITKEVIFHAAGLIGTTVNVALEVEADIPNDTQKHVVRTVEGNSRT